MNRRSFLEGLAGAAALSQFSHIAIAQSAKSKTNKPNIVLMLVDDLGYGDFACYGSTFHETPNIDRLAREGMKFTNAYAAAPVCSPSRAGIMTGQAPARLQLTQWIPGVIYPHKKLTEPSPALHLPKGVPTLASELKALGYQTASIGKWHLGKEGYYPENFGFDVNVAGDNHGHPAPPHGYFGPFKYHNLTGYTQQDNLTEVLTQKTDEFLEQAAPKGPFFLYLAEYAVHMPLQERPEHIAKYKRKNHNQDEPDPVYAAMVESVDTALGRVRAKLEQLGVADNTIIVLTSDNGGVGFQGRSLHRIGDNGPLHGGKGFMYEGGIREPLIVHWPGVTKAGSISDVPVWGCDFLPTFISMAGGPLATRTTPCDGLDISPLLRGTGSLHRDTLYWHYPHYSDQGGTPTGGMRQGDWKLIEFFEDGHLELYNLKLDEGEQYDFASTYSDKAMQMHAQLKQWREGLHAQMPSPNPNYDPSKAGAHEGILGCSAKAPAGGRCWED
ncbi:MAG: sulfatase [Acidobacteria bacterium]|nr:sulfatase [Acidobacteriota bacterium]